VGRYKIGISYNTGDSLSDEDRKECLELEWDILDMAKRNLKAIKDHYVNVYRKIERSSETHEKRQEMYKKHENEWWFVKELTRTKEIDNYVASNYINLQTDSGNIMQMRCYWCGHFESLHGAEIIVDESDMKFEI